MSAGSFAPGERFRLNDAPWRISRIVPPDVVVADNLQSGRVREFNLSELLGLWRAGDLVLASGKVAEQSALNESLAKAHADAFVQSYSDTQQAAARGRLVYVTRLASVPRSEVATKQIVAIWKDRKLWRGHPYPPTHAPHFTTVAKWTRQYQAADADIRVLVGRKRGQDHADTHMDPAVRQVIDDLIETRYLTEERPTRASVYKEIKQRIDRLNATRLASEQLAIPSFGALRRSIAALNAYDVSRARYGKRIADIRFRVAGRGVNPQRPLARAAMDHCRLDVFVVDERTALPLGRPWLTLIIDECTRYVLGYFIGFEEPGSVSMIRALRNAIGPKEASDDTKSQWDAWGIMDTLVVDNGMEFHSQALEMGAGRYGITVQFCPRKKPWYKAKVERFFGTLNSSLLSELKGKTFSSTVLRGDYDPKKHAVMTLTTLRRVIHKWVVDIYHQSVHGTLKQTPAQAWAEGIGAVDRYLPAASVEMESAFSSSCERRLTHRGIEYDSLFYNSPELGKIRERYGNGITVEIRTQADDIGSIVVVAPDSRTLVTVPAVEFEYANGLTQWQHGVCKRHRANEMVDRNREISLLDAREELRAWIEEDMKFLATKTRNRQKRFLGEGAPTDDAGNQHTSDVNTPPTDEAPVAATPTCAAATPEVVTSDVSGEAPVEAPTDTDLDEGDVDDEVAAFSSYRIRNGDQL